MIFARKKLIIVPVQLAFCLAVLILFAVNKANADTSSGPYVAVAPHTFDLAVEKGQTVNDKIKIYNRGNFAIPFRINVVDFDAADETGEMEIENSTDEGSSAVHWLEFSESDFIIDPQEKKDVEFTINIPRDCASQGYYVTALFEADISTYLFNESKLQVIPKLGVLFMLKVDQQGQMGDDIDIMEYSVATDQRLGGAEKLVNFFTNPFGASGAQVDVTSSGQPAFEVKVKNNSLYHQKLAGKIDLAGFGWNLADQLEFPEITILPGRTRKVLVKGAATVNESSDAEKELSPESQADQAQRQGGFGVMHAELDLETQEGAGKQEKRWVLVLSWKLILLILLAVFGLFIIFRALRKLRIVLKTNKKKEWIWKEELKKQKRRKQSKSSKTKITKK